LTEEDWSNLHIREAQAANRTWLHIQTLPQEMDEAVAKRRFLCQIQKLPFYAFAEFAEIRLVVKARTSDWNFKSNRLKNYHINSNITETKIYTLCLREQGLVYIDPKTRQPQMEDDYKFIRKMRLIEYKSNSDYNDNGSEFLKFGCIPMVYYTKIENAKNEIIVFMTEQARVIYHIMNVYLVASRTKKKPKILKDMSPEQLEILKDTEENTKLLLV